MEQNLAALMRSTTAQAHADAEHHPFPTALVEGRCPIAGYVGLLGQLQAIYGALESTADRLADHPLAGPFVDHRLYRRDRLAADLEALAGLGDPTPLPGALAYAAAIEAAADEAPHRWVAHHYTRYLGDLSGGAMLGSAIRKAYDLTADAGASFYDFSALVGGPGRYKHAYRERLDTLGEALTPAQQAEVCDEASRSFHANQAVFEDLHRAAQVAS